MLTSVKIEVPNSLLEGAKLYAAAHSTTLTALLIEKLESITHTKSNDPLVLFSRNSLTKEQAVEAAGLRDYAQLLVAMGDADLPLPALSHDEIERQAQMFAGFLSA